MARLKASGRAKVPTSQFGVPGKAKTASAKKKSGNFPMPAGDKNHAQAALRFIKDAPASNRPRIRARANSILGKSGSKKKK